MLLCLLSLSAVVSVLVSLLVCFPVRRPSHGFLSPFLSPLPLLAVVLCPCVTPLVFVSSLFLPYCRILCPPSRGWSGLVFLLVFHLPSASLFVSFVCPLARNLLKPGFQLETTEFQFPWGRFKNLPGFGPSSSEEPCFTISIQTTWGKFEVRVMFFSTWHGARTISGGSGVSIAGITSVADVAGIMRL